MKAKTVNGKSFEEIRTIWDAPLTGFMSNGEIGRTKNGDLEIHNCSMICVTLKEK